MMSMALKIASCLSPALAGRVLADRTEIMRRLKRNVILAIDIYPGLTLIGRRTMSLAAAKQTF